VAEDQIENQYQQKQPADTEAAAMAVPAITEAAAEQQEEYEDDEDRSMIARSSFYRSRGGG